MKKLGLNLQWNDTIGGTKKGLFQLAQAVILIADKQDEIITKLNELEKKDILTKEHKDD